MTNLHHRDGHHGWDRSLPPAAQIAPGDEVELVLADCFDGQLGPDATAADVAALDLDRANPLTGPIAVDGARPGDVLAIEILDVTPGPTGWTTLIPGFGLLAEDFPDAHVVASSIDAEVVRFGQVAELATRPFLGTVGLAPAEAGPHSVIPPRRVGGNLDCRDVRTGATLLLPVEVEGALLSVGDPHATQGDGEVCGTAVETTATARLRVEVRRDLDIPDPQLELPADPTPRLSGPRHLTTGVGPDLYHGAKDATRAMIDHLGVSYGLDPADAYTLCSVAGNLRIVEVVDVPNWVVGLELDTSVLRR
jgi:acetamidase/formamidase